MEKRLLIDGKNIFPNKLKINKKINIGIVGSGKISEEYIRVIKSFNHNVSVIVSPSRNSGVFKIAKKHKISSSFNFKKTFKENKNIDAWIICTKWDCLKKYLYFFLKYKKPVLIEKSITINSNKLQKLINKKIKKNSNIMIAYNRNYYDYLPLLIHKIKNKKLIFIEANIYDPYKKILVKNGLKIKPYLSYYISSHWVSLILKVLELSKIKIIKIEKNLLHKLSIGNLLKLNFLLKQNGRKFYLNYLHFPDAPKNHSIKFYFKDEIIELSPIEIIKRYNKLNFVKKKKLNIYNPSISSFEVNKKYKPGFRYQYFDFISYFILKKKSLLKTKLNELINIYKVCELIHK